VQSFSPRGCRNSTSPDGRSRGLYLKRHRITAPLKHASHVVAASGRYVKETIAILEQPSTLWRKIFLVNWIAGISMPNFLAFSIRGTRRAELACCVENADRLDAGWLREIYYHLGKLARAEGNRPKPKTICGGAATRSRQAIHSYFLFRRSRIRTRFAPRRISEIVPGRVMRLSGFEFTEYICGVGRSARTNRHRCRYTPGRCQSAYEHCERMRLTCRNLTTVFVTHSHWDHVGGTRISVP